MQGVHLRKVRCTRYRPISNMPLIVTQTLTILDHSLHTSTTPVQDLMQRLPLITALPYLWVLKNEVKRAQIEGI